MALDLFGEEVRERTGKHRPDAPKRGHAAAPGTGPAGETCKSCQHYTRIYWDKVYRKCDLARARWTHGAGSDIRAKDRACALWEGAGNADAVSNHGAGDVAGADNRRR
jgi:hypothetical protein